MKHSMKQGEIWLINLNPTIGAEITKTRPAIVVNDNSLGKLPLKIIVPLTDWKEHYASVLWMVHILPDTDNNPVFGASGGVRGLTRKINDDKTILSQQLFAGLVWFYWIYKRSYPSL